MFRPKRFIGIVLISAAFLRPTFLQGADSHHPTDVTILTAEDITQRAFNSVADALEGVPGINLTQDGTVGSKTTVKMRGTSSSRHVLVLLNGVPLNEGYNGTVDLAQIPINIVERIEITRGGSSLAYSGEAVGGLIHIITRRPFQKGLVTELGSANGRYGVRLYNGRLRGRNVLGDLTYLPSRAYSGGFASNEDVKATDHFGSVMRSFKDTGTWGVEYYFHESRVGVPNGTTYPFEVWNGHLEQASNTERRVRTQEYQHTKFLFKTPDSGLGALFASLTTGFRLEDDLFALDDVAFSEHDTDFDHTDVKWQAKTWEVGFQNRKVEQEVYPFNRTPLRQRGAYYVSRWTHDKWTLSPQVRLDRHSHVGNLPSARLVALFSANDDLLFSSTLQRAFRAPTFDELFISTPSSLQPTANDRIEAEKAWLYDLGLAWKPSSLFQTQWTGFYSRIDDLLLLQETGLYDNTGFEENMGMETTLRHRSGEKTKFRNIQLQGSWTVQRGRRTSPSGSRLRETAMTPRHQFLINLDQFLRHNMTLTNEWRYQSAQYQYDDRSGIKLPSYVVWNIRLKVRILKGDFFAEAGNVLNRHYADNMVTTTPDGTATPVSALAPQPNRTFSAGFMIRFDN
ncbi:MAG: TonB-dependent receptor plug domain-containing protein [Elusimicrobia bacterium]|nr:TonB-dependent receptor plug domain-containing protein [Candidatus Obscuribacterium magneticum]